MSATFTFQSGVSCRDPWALGFCPDCFIVSSKSVFSHWHVHPLLYILLTWVFFPILCHFFFPHSSEHYLFTLFHFVSPLSILPLWFPILFSPPWSLILSFSNSLNCLSVCDLVPHHLHFPPSSSSRLSSLIVSLTPLFPSCFFLSLCFLCQ